MHKAIVCKIKVTPHPDPEVHSLAVGRVCGETVVVGIDTPDEQLGIYFPCELQLSKEFTQANDLVRRKLEDGTKAGGMFEENRRVRIQKLRGIKSCGFWCPVSYLSHFGDVSSLKDGDELDTFNKVKICQKYVTPRTYSSQCGNKTKVNKKCIWFPEHQDTEQFAHKVKHIKAGDHVVVSAKLHGSSQRIACNYEERPLKWWERLLSSFIRIDNKKLRHYNGTRRVILKGDNTGFHCENWREKVASKLTPYIEPFYQVYFEVVGYENNKLIMPSQSTKNLKDKSIRKQYGDTMTYTYGCEPGEFDIYVYRVSRVLPNGDEVDLTWDEVKYWCETRGVKHVPEMDSFIFDGNYDVLLAKVEEMSEGVDLVDPRHIREGVVVRVNSSKWQAYKAKSFTFKVLEGIAKESDDYQDMEEIS